MSAIACSACKRDNAADRKFCGGCGAALAIACDGCGFANQGEDRFCGGCGAATAARPATPRATSKPRIGSGSIDLSELFRGAGETTSELPRIGIGQDDLDKLFGGGS